MAARAIPRKTGFQVWYEPAAIPIYAVVGIACAGAGWYLTRLARSDDIVWDRHNNPEPWRKIPPGTNTKLYAINKDFFEQSKAKAKELQA
ncbi:hypothetical protein T439DRAFT_320379 [Meredithblackwellia eburnea MCA 4105]